MATLSGTGGLFDFSSLFSNLTPFTFSFGTTTPFTGFDLTGGLSFGTFPTFDLTGSFFDLNNTLPTFDFSSLFDTSGFSLDFSSLFGGTTTNLFSSFGTTGTSVDFSSLFGSNGTTFSFFS